MKTNKQFQPLKSVIALFISLLFSTAANAAAIVAAQSGDWNTPSTWVGEVVPVITDDVTITGLTVTVSDAQAAKSITVQSDATTAGKLIVLATGTLTASTTTTTLTLKGGEVENAGSISLTTTTTNCISIANTNASMLITSGKYSGAGTLNLDCSASTSGSAISMSQNQTTGTSPNQVFYGGIFTVGGNYTFNIASARPIFGIGIGRHTIDGTGTISVGTTEAPVSHGLIMITADFGRLTVNPNVTLSIVSSMAVANRGPIYFHNIPNATLTNKGTININGSGTNAMGSIASGTTGAATLTNEGTINIAGTYTESAIGINGGVTASFNITNTGTVNISNTNTSIPVFATPNATNSKLLFTNNANGVLKVDAGNTGIVTASGSRTRVVNSGGTITGSGIYNGAFEPSTGTIAPGGAGIAKITFAQLQEAAVNTNNLTGKIEMNINGKSIAGTDYDQILFTQGITDISGATLEASLVDGFIPVMGDKVDLLGATSITGNFAAAQLPANSSLDYGVTTVVSLMFGTTGNALSKENSVRIFNSNGKIIIENGIDKRVNIYSIDGRIIFSEILSTNSRSFESPKGIYLVETDNFRTKVLVQ
jgi:hypothetical protein